MKRRMLAVMVLVMFAIPAMAELTDYQKGAQAGIKAGFSMGRLINNRMMGRSTRGDITKLLTNTIRLYNPYSQETKRR